MIIDRYCHFIAKHRVKVSVVALTLGAIVLIYGTFGVIHTANAQARWCQITMINHTDGPLDFYVDGEYCGRAQFRNSWWTTNVRAGYHRMKAEGQQNYYGTCNLEEGQTYNWPVPD
jgi:hypothetical protein